MSAPPESPSHAQSPKKTEASAPGPAAPQNAAVTAVKNVEHLAGLYRQMQLIRRVEEECARAYAEGKIGGFLHLYIGQEAVGVGALSALKKDDYVVTTYRDHGIAIEKGMSARSVMAELFGKVTGCSKGLGGSMHLFDAANRMLGGYGIVGGHIPLATGVAYASKYRGDGSVTLCFFGEGAVSIGGFHEGLSLAALWKLPIVFICENNEYSMGTPMVRTMSVEDVSQKALAYGMDRDRFFCESPMQVRDRLKVAIDRARETSAPTLVEIRTYRFRGHSMSDPGKYRTAEELEERKKKDPVIKLRFDLEAAGKKAELDGVEREVEDEIADAVKFAEESAEPGPEILEPTTYKGAFAR